MAQVLSIDIKRDKQTGRNLGYGFIQMATHDEARAAKDQLQDAEISGRKIRIGWAQRNTALFVGTYPFLSFSPRMAVGFMRFHAVSCDRAPLSPRLPTSIEAHFLLLSFSWL